MNASPYIIHYLSVALILIVIVFLVWRLTVILHTAQNQKTGSNHYETLFEDMLEGVQVIDRDWRYYYINKTTEIQSRRPKQELIGKRFMDMWPGVENTRLFAIMQKCLQNGEAAHFENQFSHLDDSIGWYDLRIQPVKEGILILSIDISERKRAENELRESEEKFRSLFEGHTAVMLLIEPDTGKIMGANPAAVRFYGYSHEQLLAMDLSDINCLPGEEIRSIVKNAAQRKHNRFIVPHRLASGDVRSVQVDAAPILVQGKPIMFAIINDVTEQMKIEDELVESQKMMSLGTLTGGISHEIDSPLQMIGTYSERLITELKDTGKLESKHAAQLLQSIHQNASRVTEIVGSLQSYAYPDHEQLNQADLNHLVKEALTLLEHQFKSGPYIEIKTELATLPTLTCEPNKIIQMIINLLNNAQDALPYGGMITIQTTYQMQPERLALKIIDNGQGIPADLRSRIFEPFFTTKPVGEGVGLGLSIVQGIVRAHGGGIEVESVQEEGSTFTVILPLSPPELESQQAHERETNILSGRRYNWK